MVWGAGLGARTLFLLPKSKHRTEREELPTPALYISVKLCKPFRYMECKMNKWDCDDGGRW